MNQYQQIRMYYEQQHKSIRWIARELHCSRDTVRKYIGGDRVPWDRKPGSGRRSVISDEVDRFIDACLAEDERENLRKQKHTAKRIHDRIRQELGIEIGESTIRGVVAKKREKQKPVFIPLAFDPGEAMQIDWGCAKTYIRGDRLDISYFCMRECASGAMFVMAFLRQNEESFLEAIQTGLEFFGGAPRRIIFDNARVGVKEGFGRYAKVQARYAELAAHYAFRTDFCNPAEGHEKGLVENLVEYARNNFLVPVPKVDALSELNHRLLQACQNYNDTHRIRSHELPVAQMLAAARAAFIPLPPYRYDTSRTQQAAVSDFSLVRFDGNLYSVPYRLAGRTVTVKGFGLTVEVWYENKLAASYERVFGKGHTTYRLEHYMELISMRPRSVWNAKPVRNTVPAQLLRFLEKLEDPKQVVNILRSYLSAPERVMRITACCNDYSQAMLELNAIPTGEPDSKQDIPVCRTDLSRYDQLLGRRDAV